MTISTLFHNKLNELKNEKGIIYGPRGIPKWHPLFGKKCWRCGSYTRKLILEDGSVVVSLSTGFIALKPKKHTHCFHSALALMSVI